MYTPADPLYMRRALELGARALLHATPNPRVGCVLVRDGVVLGEGFTQPPGRNHAEIEALGDARQRGHDPRGATAYVSLEPCSHFGRTPPCAGALIDAHIARVVAAIEDPNPLVAGRGLELLRGAGIDVRCGLLRDEAVEANIGFFSRMNRRRPWVRSKIAASLDGRTALPDGRSRWITSEAARNDGHAWRARSCAILTGAGTVRADDPELTVRAVTTPRQPLLVVVDSAGSLEPAARIFHATAGRPGPDGGPGVLIATARENGDARARFAHLGVSFESFPSATGRVDLAALLQRLAERGVNELHVEAGATLNGALFAEGLIDEVVLYMAPVFLGPGRPMLELPVLPEIVAARRLEIREATLLGPDLRILARLQEQ
jgi:diaminohydroxyphosphoribosylaminopyrimidine deaminase/5-amino-6-(5-phosphoribosylamino)uracil reductase